MNYNNFYNMNSIEEENIMKRIIIIGGGAAGMMAAITASNNGNVVHLFEKNNKLGKKLYITGKGRCNLTNAVEVEELLENTPGNPYFLYSAFYTMDSSKLIEFFNELGVKTKVERGNRVFPVSERASEIVRTLEREIARRNVNVHLDEPITGIVLDEDKVVAVKKSDGTLLQCDKIIVATGGLSYPMTGSTGDGYSFAKSVSHKVTKLYPSLVPLVTMEKWVCNLQGLSLKNVSIKVKVKQKVVYKDFGEMLFTHFGVSGPMILSASRYLKGTFADKPTISIDLKPALTEKELDERILRDFKKYINKSFKNALVDLLPQKIIPVIISLSKIPEEIKVNEITKQQRKSLVELLKKLTITIKDFTGFNDAVITSGGVCVDEIDPSSMESKIVKGLFFAGEVLDVDAYTGGFNLQIAFSTGYLAGLDNKESKKF